MSGSALADALLQRSFPSYDTDSHNKHFCHSERSEESSKSDRSATCIAYKILHYAQDNSFVICLLEFLKIFSLVTTRGFTYSRNSTSYLHH
jgi:hypothetical protein